MKTPNKYDKIVGANIRKNRKGMPQEKLADELGITFQQVQKYEYGTNRVSAGRLFQISKILKVDITKFYEGCK